MSDISQDTNRAQELTATEVDVHVGERIRRRRILMGLTQDQLGETLGISYQQIQKYETGANRVSAGRLFLIAQKLQIKPGWFFEGALDGTTDALDGDIGSSRMLMDFVRCFSRLEDEKLKSALVGLARAMADHQTEPAAAPHAIGQPLVDDTHAPG